MNEGINEGKQFMIEQLRESFMVFMNTVLKMPGAPIQKKQAFLRFDEGHMWMQNAVVSYAPPVLQEQVPATDAEIAAANQPAVHPVEPIMPVEPVPEGQA